MKRTKSKVKATPYATKGEEITCAKCRNVVAVMGRDVGYGHPIQDGDVLRPDGTPIKVGEDVPVCDKCGGAAFGGFGGGIMHFPDGWRVGSGHERFGIISW
jgi:hypothetical protein